MEKIGDSFKFWKCIWGNINDLHNILQNLYPKIQFTVEHSSKDYHF